ncbi:autoinducer binding domain-containing protein [Tabrizicola sp.]|uniref:autoinducer binding domain-containing protein n=1 Tax=Tabrizicola sp. TaxID=2005166 RepID=UPI0027343B9E|nr:autoinducer binding domain-containing protein [Tabrizicola sp.]MDP3195292.1 autoinducer binding domain-containing protein [Tabrizicola sp.]
MLVPITSDTDGTLDELRLLAPAGYFIGLHIRFTSPLMTYQTYDHRWVEHYTANAYVLRDPATIWGMANTGVIRWSDPAFSDPHRILPEAAVFGLRYGLTVACGPTSSRSIAGFARADREFETQEIRMIQSCVKRMHDRFALPTSLTQAQLEALRCLAGGDRHSDAASRLGISESAFKARIVSAREKLSARTTAEAIRRARDYRLF